MGHNLELQHYSKLVFKGAF